jgi:integrase
MAKSPAFGTGARVDLLFPKVTHRIVQVALKRACYAAKLRVRNPHDLRHTYATLLLMSDMSPVYVQKQLGHHSITMTVDTYGRWIPGEGRDRLDRVLRGSSGHESHKGNPDLLIPEEGAAGQA